MPVPIHFASYGQILGGGTEFRKPSRFAGIRGRLTPDENQGSHPHNGPLRLEESLVQLPVLDPIRRHIRRYLLVFRPHHRLS